MTSYSFTAPLAVWHSTQGEWWYVKVSEDVADEVEDTLHGPRRGFGAVKVRVTCGSTTWETSMFPSKELASFMLPVKQAVRRAEGLEEGHDATYSFVVLQG